MYHKNQMISMYHVFSITHKIRDQLVEFNFYRNDDGLYFLSEYGEEESSPIKYLDDIDWLVTKFWRSDGGLPEWLHDIMQQAEAYASGRDSLVYEYERKQRRLRDKEEED